ncbi:BUD13 homolog isoform X3 [Vespa mandarinia]|uniref:BUD13 homolog isoform X3 n=1 Tax=Vespa mandarinia TaxID=7446 RepID=UPI00161D5F00|nr:BUD13 homolog isoform X3 [Vespa mandarinia]
MDKSMSQKEYLKKYLSSGNEKEKKKKKKLKVGPKTYKINYFSYDLEFRNTDVFYRVKIIDDDIDLKKLRPIEDGEFDIFINGEDAPQIAGIIDERGPVDFSDKKKWKIIADNEDGELRFKSSEKEQQDDTVLSDKKEKETRRRKKDYDSDSSPIRKNKTNEDSDDSLSMRNKKNNRSDIKHSKKTKHDYDSDLSPPRKSRKDDDSDLSPPRKSRKNDDSDLSPPRKDRRQHNDSKSKQFRDLSKSHKKYSKKSSSSSHKYKDYDSDQSQALRQSKHGRHSSEKIKKNRWKDHDNHYKHHTKWDDQNDRNESKNSENTTQDTKMKKTLSGKSAGLQDAKSLREESEAFKKREAEMFNKLSKEITGAGQKAILRDSKTGRRRNLEAEAAVEREKQKRQEELNEKYEKWGKGLKQVEDKEEKLKNYLHEISKPLARYADDADLDKALREQEKEGDPMLEYIRKKKIKEGKIKPDELRYQGSFTPNRFGIKPGHRWDGVDRSNGYEKKWFEAQNAKTALQEEAYKWSTADM